MLQSPEHYAHRTGIHFLSPTWNLETIDLAEMKQQLDRAKEILPTHRFILISTTGYETTRLSATGIHCIQVNPSIFQDESRWSIQNETLPGIPQSDTCYNAHLGEWKRHSLITELTKPLFVYGFQFNGDAKADYKRVKELCPSAIFVNHTVGNGEYVRLDETQISKVLAGCKTSLCLSREEGHMRASIQSLMCGVPVVSTDSIGGRNRYYCDDTAVIVSSTPKSVSRGIEVLISRNLSRTEVRASTLAMIGFDRRNFIRTVNKLVRNQHGENTPWIDIHNFIGWRFDAQKLSTFTNLIKDPTTSLKT
jgi:hypothetical protein